MPGKVATRLRGYWRMEAANIALLPVSACIVVWSFDGAVDLVLALSLAANAVLLAIGACYWRITLLRVEGDTAPFARWLPRIGKLQPLALLVTGLTCAATIADVELGDGAWPPQRIASAAMSVLCLLEYINYYHVQLQYFDNTADFRALIRTRRLKRAHLARDLEDMRTTSAGST